MIRKIILSALIITSASIAGSPFLPEEEKENKVESEITSLKTQLQVLKEEYSRIKGEINTLKSQYKRLQREVARLKVEKTNNPSIDRVIPEEYQTRPERREINNSIKIKGIVNGKVAIEIEGEKLLVDNNSFIKGCWVRYPDVICGDLAYKKLLSDKEIEAKLKEIHKKLLLLTSKLSKETRENKLKIARLQKEVEKIKEELQKVSKKAYKTDDVLKQLKGVEENLKETVKANELESVLKSILSIKQAIKEINNQLKKQNKINDTLLNALIKSEGGR